MARLGVEVHCVNRRRRDGRKGSAKIQDDMIRHATRCLRRKKMGACAESCILGLGIFAQSVLTRCSGRIFDNTIALLPFLRDRSIALMLASAAGELCPAHFLPNPFAPNHSPTSMD